MVYMTGVRKTASVPDATRLKRFLADGLTQQQIVDAWEKESNMRVSRSAIGMAIARLGLESSNPRPEYPDFLPWIVSEDHRADHNARMLRLAGRSAAGLPLSEDQMRWLSNWKNELEEANAVVHYERNTLEGFHWVDRNDAGVVVAPNGLIDISNAVKTPAAPAPARRQR